MATYPQHTTIVSDDDFEAALSLSSKDGSGIRGIDNDDCDLNLDLFNSFTSSFTIPQQ
jgi:hypothetical protein